MTSIITTTTTITDSDGRNAYGQLVIRPNKPFVYGGTPTSVTTTPVTRSIVDGKLGSALSLAVNTGDSNVPTATYYIVDRTLNGQQDRVYWQIDAGDADPLEISDITEIIPEADSVDSVQAHVGQANPHTQYAKFTDGAEAQTADTAADGGGKFIRASSGKIDGDWIDPATLTYVDASAITIADAGGYYTTDNVEAALQQVGPDAGISGKVQNVITSEETYSTTDDDQLNDVINKKVEGPISSGTAGEITGATYSGVSLDTNADGLTSALDCAWGDNGLKLYGIKSAGSTVYQYTLTTAYDLSTASFDYAQALTGITGLFHGIAFNADGTKLFALSNSGDVWEFALATGWEMSTVATSATATTSVPTTQITQGRGIKFNTDGTKMFIAELNNGGTTPQLHEYALNTAFSLLSPATVTFTATLALTGASETQTTGFDFNSDGTRLFHFNYAGTPADTVFQYNFSTGFDVTTGSYASKSAALNAVNADGTGIALKPDGTKFVTIDNIDDEFYEYDIVKTYAGRALSWAAGFNWDTTAAASATAQCPGPVDNLDAVFLGTAAFGTSNRFQIRLENGTGNYEHYEIKPPEGTTWSDFVVMDIGAEKVNGGAGIFRDEVVRMLQTSTTQIDLFLFDHTTGNPVVAWDGSIQIGRVRDLT